MVLDTRHIREKPIADVVELPSGPDLGELLQAAATPDIGVWVTLPNPASCISAVSCSGGGNFRMLSAR